MNRFFSLKYNSSVFLLPHGVAHIDDLRNISGVIYVVKHDRSGKNACKYKPYEALHDQFVWESRLGVFSSIFP